MENCISIHVLCIFKGKYLKRWLKLMDCSAAENVFIQTENAKTAEFSTYTEKDISLFYSFFFCKYSMLEIRVCFVYKNNISIYVLVSQKTSFKPLYHIKHFQVLKLFFIIIFIYFTSCLEERNILYLLLSLTKSRSGIKIFIGVAHLEVVSGLNLLFAEAFIYFFFLIGRKISKITFFVPSSLYSE